jgi:hypothetical protein
MMIIDDARTELETERETERKRKREREKRVKEPPLRSKQMKMKP